MEYISNRSTLVRCRHCWLVILVCNMLWLLVPEQIVKGNEIPVTVLEHAEKMMTSQEPDFTDGDVRLRDGNIPSSGRVEVFYQGIWGTICDREWGINEANVVCRQLGYQQAIKSEKHSKFGSSGDHLDILLDHVYCHGKEHVFAECEHREWGKYHCTHDDEAGVVCDLTEPVTLSVGKIVGIVIFCVTCIGYMCLACAKNTKKHGNRERRQRLTRDYVVPLYTPSGHHHTCDANCTQSRTTASSSPITPPLPPSVTRSGGLHNQQGIRTVYPLPSYAELTDLPTELPHDLPPAYAYVIAAVEANIGTLPECHEPIGYGSSNEEHDTNVINVDSRQPPKDNPPDYVEVT